MTTPRPTARLVLVTGPVAAGKSTVARLLTERLVGAGHTVACLDVDEVARMVAAPGGLTTHHWQQAHRAHGALVAGWLATDVDVVVAHGSVFSRQETDALMASVPGDVAVLRVLLLSSFDAALRRVEGDPLRGLSKDPAFLRRTYRRFEELRAGMDPCDLVLDTGRHSAEEVVAAVWARLSPEHPPA
ncbi:dephospho-CoA kinase [Auraticoccus sp. F435]|uniref:Dephospho-CoA kinase n=1 Tax=Auraticoccus cholistanensis TaxID=2656650 RepID=A0A6A9USN5_9ACTN|nr:adenylyl-sulfate kinase [Auraticoccus cholistanensis]MVA75701.1 dephospho-CoA kinase [Auraticoccus cholistanensis]